MGTTLQLSKTDRELEKAIEGLDPQRALSFPDLFYDFLDLQLSFFCNNPDERQIQLHARLADDKYRQAFTTAMKCYGEAAEGYHDPLGDLFMNRVSHGQNGQFFTPEHICDFMARIVEPRGETINDPTSGSGRMLLAGLKVGREIGLEPHLYANDISITCSKMTLLNLLINTAGGMVTCGDSLKLDYGNFCFYKIDRLRPIFGGAIISTYWQYTLDDVVEVEDRRQRWFHDRFLEGWILLPQPVSGHKAEEAKVEPLRTEIKVDPDGQLSLF